MRTRPLDRNDGAAHRVAPVKGPGRELRNESCRQVSPSQAEMRAVLMMKISILGEQSLQMAFIQRNDVVQQVSPTASHPTLRDAILSNDFGRKFAWE
jgi:hypothetical protein